MAPVTAVFVVMPPYGQVPECVYDQKGKVVQWLKTLEEIPQYRFFRFQVISPMVAQEMTIWDFLPDYVPPGTEPDPDPQPEE